MSLQDFEKKFGTEEQCREYLFKLRWPNGYRCPKCRCDKAWETEDHRFRCKNKDCRHLTTVFGGTLFENTRKPLTQWFRVIWYVTSRTAVATAQGLEKEVGLSNRTALSMLNIIRCAMAPSMPLKGVVAVDNFFFGGNYVLIAVEEGVGQVRMTVNRYDPTIKSRVLADHKRGIFKPILARNRAEINESDITDFINDYVEQGSTIVNNGSSIYGQLTTEGFSSETERTGCYQFNHSDFYYLLPSVYSALSELYEKGLLGKLQCFSPRKRNTNDDLSIEHITNYLHECCFKFNRWNDKETWFYEILKRAVLPLNENTNA